MFAMLGRRAVKRILVLGAWMLVFDNAAAQIIADPFRPPPAAEIKLPEDQPAATDPPASETKPADSKKVEPKRTVVLSGLDNPYGVAVHPSTGEVFVADSGAGRIIRYSPTAGSASPVIIDAPEGIRRKEFNYQTGPLGLAFLSKDVLIVGDGGLGAGEDLLRFFAIPQVGKTTKYDDVKHKLGPIAKSDESTTGQGHFYAIAVTQNTSPATSPSPPRPAIFVTSIGDAKGWILRSDASNPTPGDLKPFIATKELAGTGGPMAITVDKNGNLVVGQMGEHGDAKDSVLAYYNASTGRLAMKLDTGLRDIAGLSFSPSKSGLLYAIDAAWTKPGEGGLFRLDSTWVGGQQGVNATKIAALDKPTAMAFAADGTLYMTTIGTAKPGDAVKPGQLVKFSGL